jgi:hypothetical protein
MTTHQLQIQKSKEQDNYDDGSELKRYPTVTDGAEACDEDSLCDWDDDEFELAELTIGGTGTKATQNNNRANNNTTKEASNDDNGTDDWMQASVPQASSRTGTDNGDADKGDAAAAGEEFLTKQFQRLCTPVSKKKPRCANCTRPLQHEESRFCVKCKSC